MKSAEQYTIKESGNQQKIQNQEVFISFAIQPVFIVTKQEMTSRTNLTSPPTKLRELTPQLQPIEVAHIFQRSNTGKVRGINCVKGHSTQFYA